MGDPVSENKVDTTWGLTAEAVLWPPHAHTCTCIHMHAPICMLTCVYVSTHRHTCVHGYNTLTHTHMYMRKHTSFFLLEDFLKKNFFFFLCVKYAFKQQTHINFTISQKRKKKKMSLHLGKFSFQSKASGDSSIPPCEARGRDGARAPAFVVNVSRPH